MVSKIIFLRFLATGPVKTSPILEYYFQVFFKFHIFGSVHAM